MLIYISNHNNSNNNDDNNGDDGGDDGDGDCDGVGDGDFFYLLKQLQQLQLNLHWHTI